MTDRPTDPQEWPEEPLRAGVENSVPVSPAADTAGLRPVNSTADSGVDSDAGSGAGSVLDGGPDPWADPVVAVGLTQAAAAVAGVGRRPGWAWTDAEVVANLRAVYAL